jgi:hypothetical protein
MPVGCAGSRKTTKWGSKRSNSGFSRWWPEKVECMTRYVELPAPVKLLIVAPCFKATVTLPSTSGVIVPPRFDLIFQHVRQSRWMYSFKKINPRISQGMSVLAMRPGAMPLALALVPRLPVCLEQRERCNQNPCCLLV